MRKSFRIKAWASALLTAAMITTMGGMTAFADTDTAVSKVTLTKTVAASPSNIQAPNTSFTFTVSPAANDAVITAADGSEIVVYGKGPASGASFANGADTITFAPGDDLSKTTDLTLSSDDFTKPGVYRYEITENSGTYDGMTYDTETYYLDLYVVNDTNGYKIEAVKIFKDGTEVSNKVDEDGFVFTNTYATNNVSLTKVISGNQADMNKKFEFTITVTGQDGEKFSTDRDNVVLESGKATTVSLGHNETIHIYGLSESDTYTIVETDTAADGYVTTYTVDGGTAETGLSVSGDVKDKTDDAIVFTNTKNVSTPTGIALTFAPYVLMVALAGVFAVLFLRKKREEF